MPKPERIASQTAQTLLTQQNPKDNEPPEDIHPQSHHPAQPKYSVLKRKQVQIHSSNENRQPIKVCESKRRMTKLGKRRLKGVPSAAGRHRCKSKQPIDTTQKHIHSKESALTPQ